LDEFGWALRPDALSVAFCRNDLGPSPRRGGALAGSSGAATGTWLTEHSIFAFKLHRGFGRVQACLARHTDAPAPVVDAAAPVAGWPFVESAYRRLAASAGTHGVPVTLIVFPTFGLLQETESDDLSERLTALGRELGWGVIDLDAAFRPVTPGLFLPDDPVHPSAAGYERAAAHLAGVLRHRLP
jgi:hypothetical protein